ncbi:sulfotransferase domain-containing protein [Photobacterium leiognathi]|uniref:sulfotransferase domain-containing protein n=1 Tax=Photobacterium leiognathi TaxID=553611 RepID=UPI0029819366|nr:sulfotransferase domain-containing protein [Photobacterium leiognathi]
MKEIITCTGYGGTGSSVISDLLMEFESVKSFGDFEFRFLQDPGGIRELEYGIVSNNDRLITSYYIKKYLKTVKNIKGYDSFFNGKFKSLSREYIDSLIDVKWSGYWHQDIIDANILTKLFYILELKLLRNVFKIKEGGPRLFPRIFHNEIYYSSGEKFYESTKKYISSLIEVSNHEGKNKIVFDQLVPPSNTSEYSKFFDNIKIVIVDRDPRDLFILNEVHWKEKWIPSGDVNLFIDWFLEIRKNQEKEKKQNNVLFVKFEDFIYEYERTVMSLCDFLNIDKYSHIEKKKYFNPEKSIKNTRLWLSNKQYENEINLISEKLSHYCYKINGEV